MNFKCSKILHWIVTQVSGWDNTNCAQQKTSLRILIDALVDAKREMLLLCVYIDNACVSSTSPMIPRLHFFFLTFNSTKLNLILLSMWPLQVYNLLLVLMIFVFFHLILHTWFTLCPLFPALLWPLIFLNVAFVGYFNLRSCYHESTWPCIVFTLLPLVLIIPWTLTLSHVHAYTDTHFTCIQAHTMLILKYTETHTSPSLDAVFSCTL